MKKVYAVIDNHMSLFTMKYKNYPIERKKMPDVDKDFDAEGRKNFVPLGKISSFDNIPANRVYMDWDAIKEVIEKKGITCFSISRQCGKCDMFFYISQRARTVATDKDVAEKIVKIAGMPIHDAVLGYRKVKDNRYVPVGKRVKKEAPTSVDYEKVVMRLDRVEKDVKKLSRDVKRVSRRKNSAVCTKTA